MTLTPQPLRVFVDSIDRSGAWNMAFDEFMLVQALKQDQASVRVYGWEQATVSLGYFQKDASDVDKRLEQLPKVRRLSGGGAILHHHEITYSISLPKSHPVSTQPSQLYGLAHDEIIKELVHAGVQSECRGEVTLSKDDPFLCFARQDPHDIVFHGTKIVGSAQRRRRGAVLQHGSILLKSSSYLPELLGIEDLQTSARLSKLNRSRVAESIASVLVTEFMNSPLTEAETETVLRMQSRYQP
jgi:lipoate-protein ligase A